MIFASTQQHPTRNQAFKLISNIFIQEHAFERIVYEMAAILSRGWVGWVGWGGVGWGGGWGGVGGGGGWGGWGGGGVGWGGGGVGGVGGGGGGGVIINAHSATNEVQV